MGMPRVVTRRAASPGQAAQGKARQALRRGYGATPSFVPPGGALQGRARQGLRRGIWAVWRWAVPAIANLPRSAVRQGKINVVQCLAARCHARRSHALRCHARQGEPR